MAGSVMYSICTCGLIAPIPLNDLLESTLENNSQLPFVCSLTQYLLFWPGSCHLGKAERVLLLLIHEQTQASRSFVLFGWIHVFHNSTNSLYLPLVRRAHWSFPLWSTLLWSSATRTCTPSGPTSSAGFWPPSLFLSSPSGSSTNSIWVKAPWKRSFQHVSTLLFLYSCH